MVIISIIALITMLWSQPPNKNKSMQRKFKVMMVYFHACVTRKNAYIAAKDRLPRCKV